MPEAGSIANIRAIRAGVLESGLSQSDVACWAWSGTAGLESDVRFEELCAIAGLYPETIHIVARADAGIRSVADLRGKRVSLDDPGSGTLVDARLDAFFIVAGHPVSSIRELARSTQITIVPIKGDAQRRLLEEFAFFSEGFIEAGAYRGVEQTPTITVNALWVTHASKDDELIYDITRNLWSERSRRMLDAGHPKGASITRDTALNGVGIPFHDGARRYYREAGLLR